MSTYSLTVSLGTSVGKAVRPWLLQSTVLLLHTHLSGQPEANQEPKEDTITRLLRSPVSRLMVAAPTKNCGISLLFYQRPPRSLCLTRIQCKHATLLIFITLGVGCVGEHRPSPLARLKLPANPEQSRRRSPHRPEKPAPLLERLKPNLCTIFTCWSSRAGSHCIKPFGAGNCHVMITGI